MYKELNEAIMLRSKITKYLKSKSQIDKEKYNKQRNFCVKLLKNKNITNSFTSVR